jgi:hypothetical protein
LNPNNNGYLQLAIDHAGFPQPDANRFYVVFTPPGVVVTAGDESSQRGSQKGFLGYHTSWLEPNGFAVNYAVIPYAGGVNGSFVNNPVDSMTIAASHELAEAVTDPEPGGIKGWFDDSYGALNNGEGEIGDIVIEQARSLPYWYVSLNGWAVQAEANQIDQAKIPYGSTPYGVNPQITAIGQNLSTSAGSAFSGIVATFTDTYRMDMSPTFQATIAWGDGQSSAGTVTRDGNGVYHVVGSHTYTSGGSFTFTVTITDGFSGQQATMQGTATVAGTVAQQGWVPLAGDWTGGGRQTVGYYDPTTSTFYFRNSLTSGSADEAIQYGPANHGWIPVVGDWAGPGHMGIGLYDPASSTFFLRNSLAWGFADEVIQYGPAGLGWLPIVGDWVGTGYTSIGLYDPASSTFFLRNTLTWGYADEVIQYGPEKHGWLPVTGEWNGSGHTGIGLYDPASSTFFLRNTLTWGYADEVVQYGPGGQGWLPVAGDWVDTGQWAIGLFDAASATFFLRNRLAWGYADEVVQLSP